MWNEVGKLVGKTLATLYEKREFDVVEVEENQITIFLHSTQTNRTILRREIEDSFQRLVATGQITRSEVRENFSQFNPAYVVAILARLPTVKYSLDPIRLWITDKT